MAHIVPITTPDVRSLILPRDGEVKIGEQVICCPQSPDQNFLQNSVAQFVLLGLPEDIGVRANKGIGGAHTAWEPFLKSFLNIQENRFLSGRDFLLWGNVNFGKELMRAADEDVTALRQHTARVDDMVWPLIQQLISAGKIPIVIGGGHNNAYPLLKGAALALGQPMHGINLDPHSDFRICEGRHSGNGFRYAYEESYLKRYALLGLHEAYNSHPVLSELERNADCYPVYWEDIFLRQNLDWETAITRALDFVAGAPLGVELDLDSLERALSSAATPVGIDSRMAMRYLYRCGRNANAIYLHLPEAITMREDGLQDPFSGKLLSYLVQAFVKGIKERGI